MSHLSLTRVHTQTIKEELYNPIEKMNFFFNN